MFFPLLSLFCKTETYKDYKCLVTECSRINMKEFTAFTMFSERTIGCIQLCLVLLLFANYYRLSLNLTIL